MVEKLVSIDLNAFWTQENLQLNLSKIINGSKTLKFHIKFIWNQGNSLLDTSKHMTIHYYTHLTLLHSELPKPHSFGRSECNRVKHENSHYDAATHETWTMTL